MPPATYLSWTATVIYQIQTAIGAVLNGCLCLRQSTSRNRYSSRESTHPFRIVDEPEKRASPQELSFTGILM